jgi:hypothetical protein
VAEQAAGTDDAALAGLHAVERQLAAAGALLGDAHRAGQHEGKSAAGLMLVEDHGAGRDRKLLQGLGNTLQQGGGQLRQRRIQRAEFGRGSFGRFA